MESTLTVAQASGPPNRSRGRRLVAVAFLRPRRSDRRQAVPPSGRASGSRRRTCTSPEAPARTSSSAQCGKEGVIPVQVSFPPAPITHFGERDAVSQRNRHRNCKALSVVPVIEGRQPIAAGVGGRERQRLRGAPGPPHRTDADVLTDAERPSWELDEERNDGVNVPVSVAHEANRRHGAIEIFPAARRAKHEVRVAGQVGTPRIQMSAGPPREHGADTRPAKDIAHAHRNVGQRGPGRELHSGLPPRRGRRLNRSHRVRRSASGSSRRSR